MLTVFQFGRTYVAVPKSGTGTWGLGRGTRGREDSGRGTRAHAGT